MSCGPPRLVRSPRHSVRRSRRRLLPVNPGWVTALDHRHRIQARHPCHVADDRRTRYDALGQGGIEARSRTRVGGRTPMVRPILRSRPRGRPREPTATVPGHWNDRGEGVGGKAMTGTLGVEGLALRLDQLPAMVGVLRAPSRTERPRPGANAPSPPPPPSGPAAGAEPRRFSPLVRHTGRDSRPGPVKASGSRVEPSRRTTWRGGSPG